MKATMIPVRFPSGNPEKFNKILDELKKIYLDEVEFLEPVMLGDKLPEADGLLLPNMEADVYIKWETLLEANMPIVVITTECGVSLMFDWESVAYLKNKGAEVYNPFSVELAKTIFKAIALKREMIGKKFLMFQDIPGDDSLLPDIFRVFYWWNEECSRDIKTRFGVEIVRKPLKALGEKAKKISDKAAREELKRWDIPYHDVSEAALLASIKFFIALRDEVESEGDVAAIGTNCLNEAYNSDTTPCLAYNLLYQEKGVMWGLESDSSALMTQYLFGSTIDSTIFATNIYPFLSGMPALSHEKIRSFPDVDDPDNHALLVHCGYLGCSLCQKGATRWILKPPVLDWLVGENSTVIDADVELGPITMCKLHGDFQKVQLQPATLKEYVQYPGSDCRNGGLIHIADGYRMMEKICSHHVIVMTGKRENQIRAVASVFKLEIDKI